MPPGGAVTAATVTVDGVVVVVVGGAVTTTGTAVVGGSVVGGDVTGGGATVGVVVSCTAVGIDVVLTAVAVGGAPLDWPSSTCEFTRAAAEPATSTPPIDNSIASRGLGAFIGPDGTGRSATAEPGDVQESSNIVVESANRPPAAWSSSTMRA